MTIEIRLTTGPEEDDRALDLAERVWGSRPLGTAITRALGLTGSYVSVAIDLDGPGDAEGPGIQPVGMAFGLVGFHGTTPHLHGHLAAVRPDLRSSGIGRRLKFHQRQWCLQRGIETVTWTFDPLLPANNRFNLRHLGAVGADYLVNLYGAMDDDINRGDETDRLLVTWPLRDPLVEAAAHGPVPPRASGGEVVVARTSEGPAVRATGVAVRRIELPPDAVALRRTDPDLARRWRLAVREASLDALQAGLRPVAFDDDDAVVWAPWEQP